MIFRRALIVRFGLVFIAMCMIHTNIHCRPCSCNQFPLVYGSDVNTHMSKEVIEKQNEPQETGLVDGPRLLEILFPNEQCRPSMRWLKTQEAKRAIPFMRLGRLIYYNPEVARAALEAKTQPMRGRGMPQVFSHRVNC
jgi:hypothetical protein